MTDFSIYFPFWDKLTAAQQKKLNGSALFRRVRKGTILHNGSADCTGLILIARGQLRAYILSAEGREISIYRLFERDICLFSAACMMQNIQFEITLESEKDSEIWTIPSEVYKGLMEDSLLLSHYTNQIMASRFSEVMWLMEQILWKSFDKRLAAFLTEESAIEESSVLKITHEKIGSHLGNPREVVTRMLSHFQNEGLIRLGRGSIEILDRKKLLALQEKV
ncbi:MAG: Crp/Fnr family transcriptional regulator [Lachnospiraceae bacterium]|nr:Crp/Fnr family transcriptional regulator [Lachnospiraceae bacterium]